MKTSVLLALAASAVQQVAAHTTVYAAFINGVDQGLASSGQGYIRSPPNNNPVLDVTSSAITCNVNGGTAAPKTLTVKPGDQFTFEWHHDSRAASDDIIASSHHGPVLVYIAPTATGASGSGWVKLAHEGFSNGAWAVDRLIANKGKHSITIPNIAPGNYLLRPEIIALHEGNRQGKAQFYMECLQIQVTGSGTTRLPAGVNLPGAYSATDPGILFDIYAGNNAAYRIPGPAVWNGQGSSNGGGSGGSTPTTLRTSSRAPTATGGSGSGSAALYAQCGGQGWTGPTTCASGSCKAQSQYYSQCLP